MCRGLIASIVIGTCRQSAEFEAAMRIPFRRAERLQLRSNPTWLGDSEAKVKLAKPEDRNTILRRDCRFAQRCQTFARKDSFMCLPTNSAANSECASHSILCLRTVR